MENNFQTSFIPKKALSEERAPVERHMSLFNFMAVLLFVISLAMAAGSYFYKNNLIGQISTMGTELSAARNSFEPSLITQLKMLDRRISDANEILNNHIVISPIFNALSQNTLKSIQFTKFSYTLPSAKTADVAVNMSGIARDYASIALESDQLATDKDIHNPIFSNLVLDPQKGSVTFDLNFSMSSDLVRFTKHVQDYTSSTAATTVLSNDVSSVPSFDNSSNANQNSNNTPAKTTPASSQGSGQSSSAAPLTGVAAVRSGMLSGLGNRP